MAFSVKTFNLQNLTQVLLLWSHNFYLSLFAICQKGFNFHCLVLLQLFPCLLEILHRAHGLFLLRICCFSLSCTFYFCGYRKKSANHVTVWVFSRLFLAIKRSLLLEIKASSYTSTSSQFESGLGNVFK